MAEKRCNSWSASKNASRTRSVFCSRCEVAGLPPPAQRTFLQVQVVDPLLLLQTKAVFLVEAGRLRPLHARPDPQPLQPLADRPSACGTEERRAHPVAPL